MKLTNKTIFIIIVTALIIFIRCNISISQITDKDGNVYKTVKIGDQEWMAENLNVEHYKNGDVIPQVQDAEKWAKLKEGAWCYFENNSENGKIYGKLYNWIAVADKRGLAPEGWHIPSDLEWTQLTDYLGGEKVAGGKMKAKTLWDNPNTGATNESSFSAFPGSFRFDNGNFLFLGLFGNFWSSTDRGYGYVYLRSIDYKSSGISRWTYGKNFGLSVRCVKD